MIIWYRTTEGFEGNLANIARQQTPAEAQAWLDAQEDPGQAYILLDERLIDPALLADLVVNPGAYAVQAGALHKNASHKDGLQKDGQPVDLGYTSDPAAALSALRGNPEVVALLAMSEEQLRAWLATQSTVDVFVLIRDVLAGMARATGISRL